MREIKFKYYFRNKKHPEEVQSSIFTLEELIESNPDHNPAWELIDRALYTGLKDKNGKEIYEGDIVRIDNLHETWKYGEPECDWKILAVKWNRYTFAFSNKNLYKPLSDYSLATWEDYIIEIIGNIYENPELLENNNEVMK